MRKKENERYELGKQMKQIEFHSKLSIPFSFSTLKLFLWQALSGVQSSFHLNCTATDYRLKEILSSFNFPHFSLLVLGNPPPTPPAPHSTYKVFHFLLENLLTTMTCFFASTNCPIQHSPQVSSKYFFPHIPFEMRQFGES